MRDVHANHRLLSQQDHLGLIYFVDAYRNSAIRTPVHQFLVPPLSQRQSADSHSGAELVGWSEVFAIPQTGDSLMLILTNKRQ